MNIRLYSFDKKKNSTAQPTGSYTTVTAYLKDGCGIDKPILQLKSNPVVYNYAYIPDWDRYYFKTDQIYDKGLYDLYLASDAMATHKTSIGDYQGFIVRCSDDQFYNPKLLDNVNNPVGEITHKVDSTEIKQNNAALFNTSGNCTFILTVMGEPPQGGAAGDNGLARTYALTASDLTTLGLRLLNPTYWQAMINQFTNPMDALISCFAIPISSGFMSTATETMKIGDQDMLNDAKLITGRYIDVYGDISYLNAMPLTYANNYLVREPYATYCLYLPFYGTVEIDANVLLEGAKLTYELHIDVCTGDLVYYINSAAGAKIGQYSGNCATQVPVGSQQISNPLGLAGGLVTAIGGAGFGIGTLAAGGGFAASAGALAAFGAGATTMLKSAEVKTQTNGSSSSALGIKGGDNIEVHSFIANPTFQPTEIRSLCGLMTHKVAYVKDHPGYLQMLNASITLEDAIASDIDTVNSNLNSGFFYE